MLTVNLITRMYYGITLIRVRMDDAMLLDESVSETSAVKDAPSIFRIVRNGSNFRRMK